ncbi:MAG: UDP-N-acetylmuramoyl-L-alanine--D-glutamate ligase [Atribacterota bacterium]|nr:UDP-N-acetylmuramoyl-L-alanine--D-glutamate ligase [Atribacterota bacterium]MDD4897051.1 UDP-N-acetylmuramoyl-L-alanine--D-glutamate ligase [Atribacterota bacterium]MDD5637287.1 UDP-N-acetylmuramoyl-L-alanine--D-glutamate ligase [Atribacterota bacterium]
MRKEMDLENKKITVMGLGLNQGGLGVTRFLAKSGAHVLVTDLKTGYELQETLDKLKEYNNIQFVLGQHRIQDFVNTDMIIQNPAVPHNSKYLQVARTHGIPIETDLSLFLKICPSRNLIAVGGTKGKSTVTNLIYHTFYQSKKNIVHAGNIGISVFDILPEIKSNTIVLLEISSWQLEGLSQISFQPHIAVLTNILPDHLDRYGSFIDYACSEKLIYKFQNQSDYLITNLDNPITRNIAQETPTNIFWFSTKNKVTQGSYLEEDRLIFKSKNGLTEICTISDIPIPGLHNISNILAASNIFFIYKLPLTSIQEGIKTFPGVPNRLEKIKTFHGINFYNDTCATTPDATIAAIQSLEAEPLILILGGRDKKLNYDKLCQTIKRKKNVINIMILQHPAYNASKIIWNNFQKLKLNNKTELCYSMSEAVQKAYQKAIPGTNIILSPAATSFGMFSNEFERGNSFRLAINKLTG